MLTKCPECELQVSDKAITCPHCGYPLASPAKHHKSTSNKRRRLPNGFGQISEIKGRHLRKPFRALVTVGKTDAGRPICRALKPECYFETYNDAYNALMEYNKNPYELSDDMTLIELYEKWSEQYFKTLTSDSNKRSIESAWKRAKPLYYMSVQNIRPYHLKSCILECDATPSIKSRLKSTFNLMFDYAIEYDVVIKNPARAFSLSDKEVPTDKEYNSHTALKDDELATLWANTDDRYTRIALIQCYSGWRPQELGNIMLKDVDLENWRFTAGMKTSAGRHRTVPIHSAIRDFVKSEYNYSLSKGFDRLFCCDDALSHKSSNILTYDKWRHRFQNIMPEHKAHDPRKTFITLCKKYNVDEYAIKYMVGHAVNDITEKVYTEREFSWLASEIEKIKRTR